MAHVDPAAAGLWAQILQTFQGQIPEQSFTTWIQPLKPQKIEDNALVLAVPSQFHREWIQTHFAEGLQAVLKQMGSGELRLNLEVQPERTNGDRPAAPPPRAALREERVERVFESHLNQRYQFENFVEGSSNSFARAACLSVTDYNRRLLWNPLLIYAGPGLGKTHLLQAIGNRIVARHKNLRVLYVSAERFTQDFIQALRSNRVDAFTQRYRSIDLLLVDDIQFFATKERTQIEFFHAFNTLYQNGKRIVLTSDRPVGELSGFDKRLISRFASGLVTNINPPEYEMRVAILQQHAMVDAFPLSREVADFIATHITASIRELEGVYVTLAAHCQLMRIPPTVELVRDILRTRHGHALQRPAAERIVELCCEHFNTTAEALRGKSRKKELVFVRMIAITLMTEFTNLSLKGIGAKFGDRDHSTIIHARDTIKEREAAGDTEVTTALTILRDKLAEKRK